ncbi:hypothetical protein ACRAWD_31260 [Caulobacter segnis]
MRVVKTETTSQGIQLFGANTQTTVPAADLAFANGAKGPVRRRPRLRQCPAQPERALEGHAGHVPALRRRQGGGAA